jgi:protein phosphatase
MKEIYLNSVVVFGKGEQLSNFADTHNIITADRIAMMLYGEATIRQEHKAEIFEYMFKLAIDKLRLGERAIVHESVKFLKELKEWAYARGYRVFKIVETKNVSRDGKEIIVLDNEEFRVINKVSLKEALNEKAGLLVVPDVHGSENDLDFAIEYAKKHDLYMIFLGDALDYGAKSVEVINKIKALVDSGRAHVLIGNHENKIYRWFMGKAVKLSHGNQATIDQYETLSDAAKEEWKYKFISMYHMSYTHINVGGKIGFAHAAFSDGMWWDNSQKCSDGRLAFAIYGEVDKTKENKRIYNWVDRVGNKTVYVGHDIRSMETAFEHRNADGGKVVFLDTGCSKSGCLTVAHLDVTMQLVQYVSF